MLWEIGNNTNTTNTQSSPEKLFFFNDPGTNQTLDTKNTGVQATDGGGHLFFLMKRTLHLYLPYVSTHKGEWKENKVNTK